MCCNVDCEQQVALSASTRLSAAHPDEEEAEALKRERARVNLLRSPSVCLFISKVCFSFPNTLIISFYILF